jgi:hypothetical protein
MAQIQTRNAIPALAELNCLLQSPVGTYTPSSPDPTPLRMLAFSVAEAALQADPNSPAFAGSDKVSTGDLFWPAQEPWAKSTTSSRWSAEPPKASLASRRGQSKPMWDVIDKARERRQKREKDCKYPRLVMRKRANPLSIAIHR